MFGSEVVDDDASVKESEVSGAALCGGGDGGLRLTLQEKIDGSNVSVHFEAEWQPVIQKRSGLIGSGEKQHYDVFRSWVYERLELLWEMLGTTHVLFGEWLWTQHAVRYQRLPGFFVAFDLLEKASGCFLSHSRLLRRLDSRIPSVPLLASLPWPLPKGQKLDALVKSWVKPSQYGDETAEGVYIRVEDDSHVRFRIKYRRKTFVSGREDFGKIDKRNTLASSESTDSSKG